MLFFSGVGNFTTAVGVFEIGVKKSRFFEKNPTE